MIVIDPSQPKPYIMLGLEDYETLLENKISEPSVEPGTQAIGETVKINIENKKRRNAFEEKISKMATSEEPLIREEMDEPTALPKKEMEVEERFFLEPNA